MKRVVETLLLGLVVLSAFFLRFYQVTKVPPSLNWDEVSIGYNAYSILKTGKDEWGVPFPLNFRSYGEYKLPVQIYASIPGIAVFGLNELGVRITPVIYGTLTVLLIFFLAKEISSSGIIGLLSAFFLAISPWHIQLTRASFESGFSVFWVVLGAFLFVKGFKNKWYWLGSIFPFVISIYTYNAARVFTPLFVFVLFLVYRKDLLKERKVFFISLLVFLISVIPIIFSLLTGEAAARFKLVSIINDPGFVQRINKARGNSSLPGPLPKLVHNKLTHFTYVSAGNYLSHFTPGFLFINGAGHKQHNVQGMGELYWVQAPFILVGLYFLLKKKNRFSWLIISWLLLAFIPVSVTVDSIPNALRTILAAIPYEILTAIGMFNFFKLLKKRKPAEIAIMSLTSGLIIFQFVGYQRNLYNIYPKLYSRDWQYGYKEAVSFIAENYEKYDLIVFSRTYGEPHMFTLFYLNYDPAKYQTNPNLVRFEANNWVWVLKFDKFYFPDLGDEGTRFEDIVKANPGKKILFIGKEGDFPADSPILETINFLNGSPCFEITEKI